MKRSLLSAIIVLVLILCFAVCLSACGSSTNDASTASDISAYEDESVAKDVDYTDKGEIALANAKELAALLPEEDVTEMIEEDTEHCDGAKNLEKVIGDYMEKNPEITYAYLIRSAGDSAEFLINWEDTDEYWGEEFELYEEAETALSGQPVYDKEPTTDEDGTVITGYYPIKLNGEVALVVCVDYAV